MKRFAFVAFVIAALVVTSCNPEDQYPIAFKANGVQWYASSAPTVMAGGKIYISANSTAQGQNPIGFTLNQYAMVDTFDLDSVNNAFLYGQTVGSGFYAKQNKPATIIITEFNPADKKISANFYGWLYNMAGSDSVNITEGRFSLHYQD